MELPIDQSSQSQLAVTPSPQNKKKILLIIGSVGLLVIVLIPLFLGFLTPTKKVTPSLSTPKNGLQTTPVTEISQPIQSTEGIRNPGAREATPQEIPISPEPTFNLDSLLPSSPLTPTPTPLAGPFYVASTAKNDLTYRLYAPKEGDIVYEVQLINSKTRAVKIIGYAYRWSPGDSFSFSPDYSQAIFLGGTKTDHQKISIYSLAKNSVAKTITLQDMITALPSLQVETTAVLSRMVLSPDGKKAAISYGKTFYDNRIDPATSIIVIDLQSNNMRLLTIKGLAKSWKDNSTLEYETSTDPTTVTTQEAKIPTL